MPPPFIVQEMNPEYGGSRFLPSVCTYLSHCTLNRTTKSSCLTRSSVMGLTNLKPE